MSTSIAVVLGILVGAVVGGGGGILIRMMLVKRGVGSAGSKAATILREAEEEQERLLLDAKDEVHGMRSEAESELRERRREVQRSESRLVDREENLDGRQKGLEDRERSTTEREWGIQGMRDEVEELKGQQMQALESVASLSVTEAKEQILHKADEEIQPELAKRYYDLEQQMLAEADEKAKMVVSLAIQRLAADVVAESTTSMVPLPSDDMKGRLIGREGRNIRAIEAATGVDLIVDDTPEAVTISCFDPIRREVARLALGKLIADGRIHPARVEEVVEKTKEEVEETIRRAGEQGVLDAGVRGLHPELIKLFGRLTYRYSYGENILKHSVEVSRLAGMLAGEVGADVQVTKAGGLLHDIGKALTHEVEGSHIEIGDEIARRYNLSDPVKAAIAEHHEDDRGTPEAFLVAAADAMSAARPGARSDTVEFYLKRLEALEDVANSFPGVEKSFAIQAGREVRIMVQPEAIDDVAASNMARNIVKKIEENLVYPGQIKVTVVRETRAVEFAK